jgi:hypothetical protein
MAPTIMKMKPGIRIIKLLIHFKKNEQNNEQLSKNYNVLVSSPH